MVESPKPKLSCAPVVTVIVYNVAPLNALLIGHVKVILLESVAVQAPAVIKLVVEPDAIRVTVLLLIVLTVIALLNVILTELVVDKTPVAPFAGVMDETVGAVSVIVLNCVVWFVVSPIPAVDCTPVVVVSTYCVFTTKDEFKLQVNAISDTATQLPTMFVPLPLAVTSIVLLFIVVGVIAMLNVTVTELVVIATILPCAGVVDTTTGASEVLGIVKKLVV